MTMTVAQSTTQASMLLLSRLLIRRDSSGRPADIRELRDMSRRQFDDLVTLANLNHVIVRGMEVCLETARAHHDAERAAWAENALAVERARIKTAIGFLHEICATLESSGHDVAVIKSLDH